MNRPDETLGPTPERLAKAGEDVELLTPSDSTNFRAMRLNDTWPLDALRAEGKKRTPEITADQYAAGLRYFTDWYKAGLCPSGVIDPAKERVDGGTYKDIAETVLAAQTRFNHAIKVLDYDARHVLDAVVLQCIPLHEYSGRYREYRYAQERRAAGLYVLRKALTQLSLHYAPPRRSGIVSGMAEGARPKIVSVEQ